MDTEMEAAAATVARSQTIPSRSQEQMQVRNKWTHVGKRTGLGIILLECVTPHSPVASAGLTLPPCIFSGTVRAHSFRLKNSTRLTDPLRFIYHCTKLSAHRVVGGDAGGGTLKLGVTYTNGKKKESFAPLLVMEGDDSHDRLYPLADLQLHFTGTTAQALQQAGRRRSIFDVLQLILDQPGHATFLNGDWAFLNTVLGLQCASSSHPCYICTAHHQRGQTTLPASAPLRDPAAAPSATLKAADAQAHYNKVRPALLTIPSERILAPLLHIMIGLCNKIVRQTYTEIFGAAAVKKMMRSVKGLASVPGGGGVAAVHDLNGREITRWLKNECSAKLLRAASRSADAGTQAARGAAGRLDALAAEIGTE